MTQTTIALVLFLFPLAYSPGPGNLVFAANGGRFGLAATVPALIGYHLATLIVTVAIGYGPVATLSDYPTLFITVRTAGAVYVLWLAWNMATAGALTADQPARPASGLDGAVLLILNPKAYVIIALMFSQFGDTLSVAWTAMVFTLNNLIAFCVWAALGDRMAQYFRSPRSARALNIVFGTVLAAVAVWMLLS